MKFNICILILLQSLILFKVFRKAGEIERSAGEKCLVPVWQSELDPWDPRGARKELISVSCPVIL